MKKKRRGISRYTVMFIPDTSDNEKSYELTFDTIARWIVLVLALFAIVICLFISMIIRNQRAIYGENGYIEQINELREENRELKEKTGVSAKEPPGSLSRDRDRSAEAVTADDSDVPTIFPVKGTATIIKDPTSYSESFPFRLVMLALKGSEVIVAADGVVEEIYEYEKQEDEYRFAVMVDHRNGYETVYLLSGNPEILAEKGLKLKRGDLLARVKDDETIIGYDVMYGGESLDPSDLISKRDPQESTD
ncbi:MAG: M23 family metallopeptidase [Lachnospiraceae bacterium]|nr:M23 family metallopeptidase [Lachnospiraceae bacterium]